MIDEQLQQAESLCRAVAGRDLNEAPFYLISQSSLPAGCIGEHHYGLTSPSLDLYLAPHIPNYRGRGACLVINDIALAEDFDVEDLAYLVPAFVLHELAHILDRPVVFADRTGVDEQRIIFEGLVVADATSRPPREDLPAYFGHEAGFIRVALHLQHRAEQAGVAIAPAALCAGSRYCLSHASDYQDALGDEPARCADLLFRDIAATNPPPAFSQLWIQDLVSYEDRFSLLKGVLP
jgi:hypothetical protein